MTIPASISVVIPVYGDSGALAELCERIEATLRPLTSRYEIILVDDRCPYHSWQTIVKLRQENPSITALRLSRNFGQHVAITAGLAHARGEAIVVMDCDLQDPPEYIPALLSKLAEGYDYVLALRTARAHSAFRQMGAKLYFTLLSKLTDERLDGRYGSFSILSRKVVDAFLQFGERERHFSFILRWMGFNGGTITYPHAERHSGKSSYTLHKLLSHALSGLFFQSTTLLRWIMLLGLCVAASGFLLALYYMMIYFTLGAVAGWTSLTVLLLLCTGAILFSLGVTGLYIGKIFDQVKARPLYILDHVEERRTSW